MRRPPPAEQVRLSRNNFNMNDSMTASSSIAPALNPSRLNLFWQWWTDELRALVPARLMSWVVGDVAVTDVMADTSGITLLRKESGKQVALAKIPASEVTTHPQLRELRAKDAHAARWLLAPESVQLAFFAGLDRRTREFQRGAVRLQMALEETLVQAARLGQTLLCHRGLLNPLAYWMANGWEEEEFFSFIGLSREQVLSRYTGVLHLQTAALGAKAHYQRWPEAHRGETAQQAAQLDGLCEHAWRGHSQLILIRNHSEVWHDKARDARQALADLLAHRSG